MNIKVIVCFLLPVFLLGGAGCKKDKPLSAFSCPNGYREMNFDYIDLRYCIDDRKIDINKEYIINDDSTYRNVIGGLLKPDTLLPNNCSDSLPQIDFNTKTLLGKYAEGGGCTIDFERKICKYEETDGASIANYKVLYRIKVVEEGNCAMGGYSMNLIVVPKIPVGSTITFDIIH